MEDDLLNTLEEEPLANDHEPLVMILFIDGGNNLMMEDEPSTPIC